MTRQPAPRAAPSGAPPVALPATAATSDAFDHWLPSGADPAARFLASDTAADGTASLLVTRPADDRSSGAQLSQVVAVTSAAPIGLTVTASADHATAGAVSVLLDAGGVHRLALPGGTYAWRTFTLTATVPSGVRTALVGIAVDGPTAATRIDDVRVAGTGSQGVVVQNAGFESNSADLSIVDRSLVLRAGTQVLHLETRRPGGGDLRWRISGDATASGTVPLTAGTARIVLHEPPGFYRLTVTRHRGPASSTRSTHLVVAPSTPPSAALALGAGVHPQAMTTAQIAGLAVDLRAVGVRTVRLDTHWDRIERQRGRYDFAELDREVQPFVRAGIRPLLIADYANPLYDGGRTPSSAAGVAAFGRFAAAVARHEPDADIDVWNEFDFRQNTGRCGTSPRCYLTLLTAASTAIRATGTTQRIAAPSIAGTGVDLAWLGGFLAAGGAQHADALALHPYTDPEPPDSLAGDLDTLRRSLAAHGSTAPLWFTEVGWSTVPGGVTRAEQAADLVRVEVLAAAHDVQRVYWYDALDDGDLPLDRESNFGLFARPSSFAPAAVEPKPAAAAEAMCAALLGGGRSIPGPTLPPGIGGGRVAGPSGSVEVLWPTGGEPARLAGHRFTARTATGGTLPRSAGGVVRFDGPVFVTGSFRIVTG